LNESFQWYSSRHRESVIGAISAGAFFILIGFIFVTTPGLFDRILDFFRDFNFVLVPNTGIYFFAPVNPGAHLVVYAAVRQFSLAWCLFQIVILALRIAYRSPLNKKAETVSNLVFWLGVAFLIDMFLNEKARLLEWFVFWSTIIMLLGLTLIVRAIIIAAASTRRVT